MAEGYLMHSMGLASVSHLWGAGQDVSGQKDRKRALASSEHVLVPWTLKAEARKGYAGREGWRLTGLPWRLRAGSPGGSDDVFSSSQGVWQKLEGQRKRGEGSLLTCQGRAKGKNQQSQQTHKHRANRPSRMRSQLLVPLLLLGGLKKPSEQ